MSGFDPFKLSTIVYRGVARIRDGVEERRYYRFRGGRWYGGIATGDVVGCNLRCKFCWSWRYSFYTNKGFFQTPQQVYEKLTRIAEKRKYKYIRLSGGEPTITMKHVIQLLELLDQTKFVFILETNGLLIGYHRKYAEELATYRKIAVRVSFKGTTPEEFEQLTGADKKYYGYQFKALENLIDAGLKPGEQVYPAVMLSFSPEENIKKFLDRLRDIHPVLAQEIDPEYVILYPHVVELLRKNKLKPRIAYKPNGIPEFMI
ncbi:Radical SAM domain protein [Staphylothermus marinus F1]|uniref:Radical SAM domain protein n=1 Tax=Staphylothermus marinus (strain ATCC 43588 / DSM 3639 / JCM 9404 / F1) TaxID=399550 RepID=A3DL36_STAMF|nr:radical SAM protein [Staphylothermus marinus]ABN69346.1 Radical SAM domain protein [Staphylothermus marinus F1]